MPFGLYGDDPNKRMMLAMMMAGMAGGMGGQRGGGWSSPLGGAARGLAQTMPAIAQMQAYQQEQMGRQKQAQAMAQAAQQISGQLPQGNPYGPVLQAMLNTGSPEAIQSGMQMLPRMIEWAPPEQDLKQVYDPATKSMVWISESEAEGRASDLPLDVQERLRRAQATNVSVKSGPDYQVGSIPPGWVLRKDDKGGIYMEAIDKGPVATAQAATQKEREQTADIVIRDIDRANKIIDEATIPVTGIGSYLSWIPATPAHDLRQLMTSLRANVSFDKLQAMRAASPTGGALGPVSDLENKKLESALGSLEQSQSKKQLKENLQRVNDIYLQIVHGPGAAQPDKDWSKASEAEIEAELRKRGYIP